MKYMVSTAEKPQNFPIYAVHSDIDSYILFNDNTGHTNNEEVQTIKIDQHINEGNPDIETLVGSKDGSVQEDKSSDDETKTLKQDQESNKQTTPLETKLIPPNEKTALKIKLNEGPKLQLISPNHRDTIQPRLEQEILWFLEFDGSINKLGVGAGVWVHNKQNSHA